MQRRYLLAAAYLLATSACLAPDLKEQRQALEFDPQTPYVLPTEGDGGPRATNDWYYVARNNGRIGLVARTPSQGGAAWTYQEVFDAAPLASPELQQPGFSPGGAIGLAAAPYKRHTAYFTIISQLDTAPLPRIVTLYRLDISLALQGAPGAAVSLLSFENLQIRAMGSLCTGARGKLVLHGQDLENGDNKLISIDIASLESGAGNSQTPASTSLPLSHDVASDIYGTLWVTNPVSGMLALNGATAVPPAPLLGLAPDAYHAAYHPSAPGRFAGSTANKILSFEPSGLPASQQMPDELLTLPGPSFVADMDARGGWCLDVE